MKEETRLPNPVKDANSCYHCGEDCGSHPIIFDEKQFCCSGCNMVYEILHKNNASEYYRLENHPGKKATDQVTEKKYAYLDNEEIRMEMMEFSENGIGKVKLLIPAIHCSACIWLLENLQRFHTGILH
jgi:P-type Cu+ transporter